jgi:hypothetical protein
LTNTSMTIYSKPTICKISTNALQT